MKKSFTHASIMHAHEGIAHAFPKFGRSCKKMLIVYLGLLFTSNCLHAQQLRLVTDSASGHGLAIYDRKFDKTTYEWKDARHIVDSIDAISPGWRLPTSKELKTIFDKTFNAYQLRSTVTDGDCYTSDFQAQPGGNDTVHIVGTMRGRKYQGGMPMQATYNFILVKDF